MGSPKIKRKKKFNCRTFRVHLLQARMGRRAIEPVNFPQKMFIKHKFFKCKVVNNSPLPIDYNYAVKNSAVAGQASEKTSFIRRK